jgi:hypothetical protein
MAQATILAAGAKYAALKGDVWFPSEIISASSAFTPNQGPTSPHCTLYHRSTTPLRLLVVSWSKSGFTSMGKNYPLMNIA